MQVRPCLYCIILLTALFGSSCYWEPIATELLLQRNPQLVNTTSPETNVTSLVELVGQYHQNASEVAAGAVSPSATDVKTAFVPQTTMYERCWCDLAASVFLSAVAIHDRLSPLPAPLGPASPTSTPRRKDWKSPIALFPPSGFFEPYDQAAWESASLVRHARQLMPPPDEEEEVQANTNSTSVEEAGQKESEEGRHAERTDEPGTGDKPGGSTKGFGGFVQRLSTYKPRFGGESLNQYWRTLKSMPAGVQSALNRSSWVGQAESARQKEESPSPLPTPPSNAGDSHNDIQAPTSSTTTSSPPEPEIQLPMPFGSFWMKSWRAAVRFFGEKHDLTPYGLPVIVDFGWSRQA